jgi:hypothetical protein
VLARLRRSKKIHVRVGHVGSCTPVQVSDFYVSFIFFFFIRLANQFHCLVASLFASQLAGRTARLSKDLAAGRKDSARMAKALAKTTKVTPTVRGIFVVIHACWLYSYLQLSARVEICKYMLVES